MILIALVLLSALVIFWAWASIARRRLRHVELYEKYSKEFYQSSRALIADEDTPSIVLELIGFINSKMPKTSSGREFLLSILLSKEDSPVEDNKSKKQTYDEIKAFFKTRPELEKSFEKSCKAALRAVSYRSFIAGFLMRRLFLFDDAESHDRPAQLIVQLERRIGHHGHSRGDLAVGC